MNGEPLPAPQTSELMQAHENYRDFTELMTMPGWSRFVFEHNKTLDGLRRSILETLPPGEERDAAIARYRVLKSAIELPEKTLEGARLVIQNNSSELQDEDE